ncbi:GL24050 [Drosophila persimilis]|uniref:GL24050 n=1 Tax=Drosophila persimilis TaxID=7234 RepID=B4G378_DROPE|nr:GL24050 [Drosophila persimilis]
MLPTWLTEEYIQTHLRAYCKDGQLRVLKLWAKPATEKGGNYVGVMTRIYVDYEDRNGTEYDIGVTEKLTAEAVVVDRERTIMILEDLATLRYVNADRVKQLDLNHTKMTIDMLARFHAAAIVLNQRYPEILAKILIALFLT